jgi:hypothetical protein
MHTAEYPIELSEFQRRFFSDGSICVVAADLQLAVAGINVGFLTLSMAVWQATCTHGRFVWPLLLALPAMPSCLLRSSHSLGYTYCNLQGKSVNAPVYSQDKKK